MPAGYPAVTGVESTLGDAFTFEISDLRVTERLPYGFGAIPANARVLPAGDAGATLQTDPSKLTRRPSNIVPNDPDSDENLFYLGLDVHFVGTALGRPTMPTDVNLEVRFFLEAYGVADPGTPQRHEINIHPVTFGPLGVDPSAGDDLEYELWVQVAQQNFADNCIEGPAGVGWDTLFQPETVYRIAASVKLGESVLKDPLQPEGLGFIAGAAMQIIEA